MPTRVKKTTQGAGRSRESIEIEIDKQWKPIFDKYDEDGDGQIPLEELKVLLQQEGDKVNAGFPPEVINEIVERADWDENRFLSYNEFLNMVHTQELASARPRFQRLIHFAAFAVVPRKERSTCVRKYMEEYTCMPPPLFMIIASLIEIGVFIYYCVKLNEVGAGTPVPIDSVLIYNPRRRKEAWRYLTYMFIHAGLIHLIFNLLVQLVLGIPLEMVHRSWRVGLVYIAGVLAGSLGSSLSDPETYLAGASGGVYALIAAHLANVIINYKEMEFGWARLLSLILFAGMDVGVAIYYRYIATDAPEQKTSYAAHFAGALAGLLLGVKVLRNLCIHKWETILGWILLVIYIALMLFAIFWNAFNPDFFLEQKV